MTPLILHILANIGNIFVLIFCKGTSGPPKIYRSIFCLGWETITCDYETASLDPTLEVFSIPSGRPVAAASADFN